MKKSEIKSNTDLQEVLNQSNQEEVLLFKHSTRCGISKMALRNFEREVGDRPYFYLDILSHRDLSNKIAEEFDVKHESPQLIYFKDGKVIKSQSHHKIGL